MSENKYQFKGTPAPWYPVEYSGFWDIQDEPFYSAKRITSYDSDVFEGTAVSEKVAKANVMLMAAAPDILEACIKMVEACHKHNLTVLAPEHYAMQAAIHKALNIID